MEPDLNAKSVLTDPKRRCLVEELRDHTIHEVVLVLRALGYEVNWTRLSALNDGEDDA